MKYELLFKANRVLTDREKETLLKEHLSHKIKVRKWHKANKDHKGITMYRIRILTMFGEIWENVIEDQIYQSIAASPLINRIW
jgi:hypothetical protein